MRIFLVDFGGTTDVGELRNGDMFIKSLSEFWQFISSGDWQEFDIGFFFQGSVADIEKELSSLKLPIGRLWLVFNDYRSIIPAHQPSSLFTSEMLVEFYSCARKGDKPAMAKILSMFLLPTVK